MQIQKIAYKCRYIRLHTNANTTDSRPLQSAGAWDPSPKPTLATKSLRRLEGGKET